MSNKSKVEVYFNPSFVDGQVDRIFSNDKLNVMVIPSMEENNFIAQVNLVEDVSVVIFSKFFTFGCGLYPEWDWNTNLPIFPVRKETIKECNKGLISHIAFVRNKVTGQLMSGLFDGKGKYWSENECEIYVWKPCKDEKVFKDEDDEVLDTSKCYKVDYKHFVKCLNALRKVAKKLQTQKDTKGTNN